MSIKSIIYSILSVLLFYGFLALTVFLFAFYWVLGLIGIAAVLIVPFIFTKKAIVSAVGFIDKLIAKFFVPVLMLMGVVATLLIVLL